MFSNNDANVIFSSEVRFEDNTNDGWQSGCYDKALASFKTDFVRRVVISKEISEKLSPTFSKTENNSSKAPTRSPSK